MLIRSEFDWNIDLFTNDSKWYILFLALTQLKELKDEVAKKYDHFGNIIRNGASSNIAVHYTGEPHVIVYELLSAIHYALQDG